MKVDDRTWQAHCAREERVERTHETSIELDKHGLHEQDHVVSLAASGRLRCTLTDPHAVVSEFVLDLGWTGPDAGRLSSAGDALSFGPSFEQRNQPFGRELAGYLIRDARGPIAALDTGGKPRVAFAKALEPARRDLVAATCVALLMVRFLD